jgi:hypothetical protein
MNITPGRIVNYRLSAFDVTEINRRRGDFRAFMKKNSPVPRDLTGLAGRAESGEFPNSGHVGHIGNEVSEGDVYPAVAVRVFSPVAANLQVFLDGNDTFWATSRGEGDLPGFWQWPEQEKLDVPSPLPAGVTTVRDEVDLGVLQIQHGISSIDEIREKLDLPPWGLPETSEPVIFTAQGPVPFSKGWEFIEKAVNEEKEPEVSFTIRQVAELILELQRRTT